MCSCKKPVVKFCFKNFARFSLGILFFDPGKRGSFSKRACSSEIHKAHCWASLALQNLKEAAASPLKQSHEGLMLPLMSLRLGLRMRASIEVGNPSHLGGCELQRRGGNRPFAAGCTSVPAWSQ